MARFASSATSYNLYLGMYNWLRLQNDDFIEAPVLMRVYGPGPVLLREETVMLPPNGAVDLDLHNHERYGTAADSYGLVTIETLNRETITGQMLRIKPLTQGVFDFVMPINVD